MLKINYLLVFVFIQRDTATVQRYKGVHFGNRTSKRMQFRGLYKSDRSQSLLFTWNVIGKFFSAKVCTCKYMLFFKFFLGLKFFKPV